MSKCKVIAVANQKGGVGKTTTTLNLAEMLRREGNRVLAVDFDPQSNLTMCFGVDRPEELGTTLYHLMLAVMEERPLPEKESYMISRGGVDLIPCSIELSAIELNLVNAMSREITLKTIIDTMREHYDYIVLDCMPSLGMLTINALVASDSVLIVATPQYLSAKGLELLLRTIIKVKKKINPKLIVDGILINMYNKRTKLSTEVLSIIEEAYSGKIKLFDTKIPTSVKVGESNLNNESVVCYSPYNPVALAYTSFVKEYIGYE